MNTCIISCVFGTGFNAVHRSPIPGSSYMFTNNPSLKEHVISRGWEYIYVDAPLNSDILSSSLQSKYVKFMKFLTNDHVVAKYKRIIYVDHKEKITKSVLDDIIKFSNENDDKSLIIRTTPRNKTSVYHEIRAAIGDHRYRLNMNKTLNFIKSENFNTDVRICNTGFMVINNYENIKDLYDKVYEKCMEHGQPECQIYFALFYPELGENILKVDWLHFNGMIRTTDFN
jgi:hypothetical protein